MNILKGPNLLFYIVCLASVGTYGQAVIISPPDGDAATAYFQQDAESPDGNRMTFTIFHAPDSMEVVVKDLRTDKLTTVAKIEGQHRHTGAHPIWVNDHTLIYGSPSQYVIYHHDLKTGKVIQFPGELVSDYSPIHNALLFANERNKNGPFGIYIYNFDTHLRKRLLTSKDVKHLANEMGTENPSEIWSLGHPYWSPSGDKINFVIKSGGIDESASDDDFIFYADQHGKNVKFIGKKPMHFQWWDNNSIFGHDWHDKNDKHMRSYDLNGEVLEEVAGYGCHGAVSPKREWIVTESWYGSDPIKVFLYKRGYTEPTKILFEQPAVVNGKNFWNVRSHVHPSFSRDGKKVYFNAQGADGKSKVMCYDLTEIIKSYK